MNDYSDCILLSFGDSFTFGDGLLPSPMHNKKESYDQFTQKFKIYANNTKQLSYTKVLADKMGFKGYLNFGISGGSNSNSLRVLTDFLNQNSSLDPSKYFILFGLTSMYRDTISYTNDKGAIVHKAETTYGLPYNLHSYANHLSSNLEESLRMSEFFFHKGRMFYQHLSILNALKIILDSYNARYMIFDIINDTNSPKVFDEWTDHETTAFPYFYDREKEIATQLGINYSNSLKETSGRLLSGKDFRHYYNTRTRLREDKKLILHDGTFVDDEDSVLHLNHYMNIWAIRNFKAKIKKDAFHEHFISEIDNAHWNKRGHQVVADVLQYWIEQQDYSYLEN